MIDHQLDKAQCIGEPPKQAHLIDHRMDEEYDTDEYTLKMASHMFLKMCAEILDDDVVDPVISFVTNNATSREWQNREAAILALGSIMEGPSSTSKLKELLAGFFEYIFKCFEDSILAVRDTTASIIVMIVKFHTECARRTALGKIMSTHRR